ncbi:hypothetical protein BDD12DRAFT_883240 [Trichophaea hybrida]|nr:hypothetical protein BDD12DRAFT_883240 [Trichophaea hybrida]
MAHSDEVDHRSPSADFEFTSATMCQVKTHQDVGSESNGEAPEGHTTSMWLSACCIPEIPNRTRRCVSGEGVHAFPDEEDVIFGEFANKVIALSKDLAWHNTTRLGFNKLAGWQMAMCEVKELIATELRQLVSGEGYNGKKLIDSRYSLHVA